MRGLLFAVLVLATGGSGAALAHGEAHEVPWRTAPHLVAALLLMAVVYARGVQQSWRRGGRGAGLARWQVGCFVAGWLTLVAALVTPIDALAEELASVHMIQHLALMLVAAPLLVLGAPALAALWALPRRWRSAVARHWRSKPTVRDTWAALSQPMLAWLLYFVVLWGWHLPSLYEAALANRLVHDVQHLLFFGSAALVWWIVLNPLGGLRLEGGAGVLYLFTTSLHAMALGVFMALSPRAWYGSYEASAPAWGFDAVQDQQIAGVIMWMPAAMAYVVLAALIFWLWLRQTEAATSRIERAMHPDKQRHESREALLLQAEESEAP
jgi:putative membrane protein